jgi:hypothetical protein
MLALSVLGFLPLAAACGSSSAEDAETEINLSANDQKANDGLYDCLLEKGFAVTKGPNGEVNFVDPEDTQFSAYSTAERECQQQLVAEGLLPAVDGDSLRREYENLLALNECLSSNGFETKPFPSEQVFLEEEGNMELFVLETEEDWARADTDCPEQMAAINEPAG